MNTTPRILVTSSPSFALSGAVMRRIHNGSAKIKFPPFPRRPASTPSSSVARRADRPRTNYWSNDWPVQKRMVGTRGRGTTRCKSSSTGGSSSTGATTKNDPLPPLPPSPPTAGGGAPTAAPPVSASISPAQAKQRYLESKRRTEAFLRDPQGTVHRLQTEMDDVRVRATERLEREVQSKTVWQRLFDPLKRKQHSLINMVAATMAYILAHQLHLKRKAWKQAVEELTVERERTKRLQELLQSLVEDECIQELADHAAGAAAGGRDGPSPTRRKMFGWWWPPSTRESATPDDDLDGATEGGASLNNAASDSSRSSNDLHESLATALRSVLEARIGDDRLDDETRKQRAVEKIWEENKEQLKQTKRTDPSAADTVELQLEASSAELDDIAKVLPRVLFEGKEFDDSQGNPSDTSPNFDQPSTGKIPRRVFDL